MHRSWSITLPADTNTHNLWTLITGTYTGSLAISGTGVLSNGEIVVDQVCSLKILATLTNGGNTIVVSDGSSSGSGQLLGAGDLFQRDSTRNNICLKEYNLQGSANSQAFTVDVDSI